MLRTLLLMCCVLTAATQLCAADQPNIIVILADDLGYGDLGCYGHPSIRTPHLDRMAAEGMRFTDFYSAGEVCTPSRAALLTGRYPIRSGMCHDRFRVTFRSSVGGLPASEVTIPAALKAKGYATGMVGKWHLGVKDEYHPNKRGFDYFFGLPHSNDMDPSGKGPKNASKSLEQDGAWWNAPLFENEKLVEQPTDQTQLTRRYTEKSIEFIKQNKEKPFFLYVPHNFPHVPLFASEKFRGKSPRGLYGDVVEELDWSVGEILEALRRENLDKKTLVFFTSDNGPWLIMDLAGGSAGLLKDGKGSTWEGGMRVPGIAWWPGKIKPNSVSRALACNMDLFSTALKLAGADAPTDRAIDGVDLSPVLFGAKDSVRENFFYYRGAQLYAARKGDWKAHFTTQSGYAAAPTKHERPLLFNLAVDPSENFDVGEKNATVISEIAKLAEAHRGTVVPVPSQLEKETGK